MATSWDDGAVKPTAERARRCAREVFADLLRVVARNVFLARV
jgi:hypothetical protein